LEETSIQHCGQSMTADPQLSSKCILTIQELMEQSEVWEVYIGFIGFIGLPGVYPVSHL
jgi:hypothetical protein